jgi:geranylgeranyl diphosphate synthase type I
MGQRLFPDKDPRHFGISMALIVGDMIAALGNQIIFNSGFNEKLIIKALFNLQSIISYTVIGEVKDFYIEYKGKATEKDVLDMYEYKTAKYTIEGPLHLGAVLGGSDSKLNKEIIGYSIPTGIAFQIQDDILGIFGNGKKLGKEVGSDIKEGKMTLLVVKAREKASKEQRKMLDGILGKENLTSGDIKTFRDIIRETGALAYAESLAYNCVKEGKKKLDKMNIKKEAKDFLLGMSDYMINREA